MSAVAAAILARAGDPSPAAAMIEELTAGGAERPPPTMIASLPVAVGDRERILAERKRGLTTGDPSLPFIHTDPVFDPLRDERFASVPVSCPTSAASSFTGTLRPVTAHPPQRDEGFPKPPMATASL